MVAMIITGVTCYLGMIGVITFTVDVVIPLAGLLLGLLLGVVLLISAWLLASGIVTIAGLQKNEAGFLECKRWWKKWNRWMDETNTRVAKIPKDSCQFYWHTVSHMVWSPISCIIVPIAIIITITINLAAGRVPKLRSLTAEEGSSEKPCRFTEEYCRLSPVTMYGVMGIYFFFMFIGHKANNINWENVNLSMPIMLVTAWIEVAEIIGIVALMSVILWKRKPIKKFIKDCWGIAMDLKEATREKFCIRIVE